MYINNPVPAQILYFLGGDAPPVKMGEKVYMTEDIIPSLRKVQRERRDESLSQTVRLLVREALAARGMLDTELAHGEDEKKEV